MSARTIIDRLVVIWGSPESVDDPAYIAEIDKAVKGTSPALLEMAADWLIKNYRGARFPTPAQIVNALREVTPAPTVAEGERHVEWSPEAMAQARRLIQSEMGRKAAREGWILSLHDYCRKHGDLPPYTEIGDVIKSARGFDEAYASLSSMKESAFKKALINLGDSMLERRNKYAAIAMGGDA